MGQTPEQNPQPEDLVPYQPENQSQLFSSELAEPQNVDLDSISQYLVKRVKGSDNIEEVSKIVSVLSSIEDLKERRIKQNLVKTKTQEAQKEVRFRRRIEITELVSKKLLGAASLIIGFYILNDAPLFSPILITIGLSGFLDFKLKDVSDLIFNLNKISSDLTEEKNDNK